MYNRIKESILTEINPEKMIFLDLGPLDLLVVVWDANMSNFEKRVYIRRLLKFLDRPVDISAYSSEEYNNILVKRDYLTFQVYEKGSILYEKKASK